MIHDLEKLATRIRLLTLRTLLHRGYGHFGGSLSIVEALAVLYGKHLNYADPKAPDRFILSKGHAGPALYACLSLMGFFDEAKLNTLNANGTRLPSHPDRVLTEGVDMTTGSMGQGISVAAGLAYALRAKGTTATVYVVTGDGELNEGQCWEAFQFIAHQRLTNLIVMVDENGQQLDGPTNSVCEPFDYVEKLRSFGLEAIRVDGQDVAAIDNAVSMARRATRPPAIVLRTTKGAGVSCIANRADNHHVRLDEELKQALAAEIAKLEEQVTHK